jgi:Flp pilus assembly protein TadD
VSLKIADYLSSDTSAAAAAPGDFLRGRTVCYAGRLVSMGHEEFVEVVTARGARYGRVDSKGVIVVGEADWPLARPAGSSTDRLKAIDALEKKAAAGVTLIGESQFVERLGLDQHAKNLHQLFSTATLTHLLDISRERIRAWVKAGLVKPASTEHGVWHFDFRQVCAARTLTELSRSGIGLEKIRKSLARLLKWMPELEQPLEQLAALEKNGPLLVRLEAGELAEPDGQLHFEFTQQPPPGPMKLIAGPRTAGEWAAQGLEQEREGYLEEAAASYRQSLLTGGPEAQTCLNLGNVLRALGNKPQALERYSQAVEIDSAFVDAWNNLGTLLVELERPHDAIAAFHRALAADAEDFRAHYNLADTLDELGLNDQARAHWEAYLRYDPQSQWGAHARRRLSKAKRN